MKWWQKCLLTVLLALLVWLVFSTVPDRYVKDAAPLRQHDDQDLVMQYHVLNAEWFGGRLPSDTIVRFGLAETPDRTDNQAVTRKRFGKPFTVELNPRYNITSSQITENELHEMCHIAHWGLDDDHGPVWQACMLDLAQRGALTDVW